MYLLPCKASGANKPLAHVTTAGLREVYEKAHPRAG